MLTTLFVMAVSLVICWALLGVLNVFRPEKVLSNSVDPLSLLEGEDKIWADNMLLKAGIIEEPKRNQTVVEEGVIVDHKTNSLLISKEYADKYNESLRLAKQAKEQIENLKVEARELNEQAYRRFKSVDSRKIDEFKAKVEARSMVTIYERTQADKKLPINHEMENYINYIHGMMTEVYASERREPVAYYSSSRRSAVLIE